MSPNEKNVCEKNKRLKIEIISLSNKSDKKESEKFYSTTQTQIFVGSTSLRLGFNSTV